MSDETVSLFWSRYFGNQPLFWPGSRVNYKHTQELDRTDKSRDCPSSSGLRGVVKLGLDPSEPGKDIVEFIYFYFY